jgi:hypothetical protein
VSRRQRSLVQTLLVAALCVAAAAAFAAPAAALAPTLTVEGTTGAPFSFGTLPAGAGLSGGENQSLALTPIVKWRLDGASPIYAGFDPTTVDPRSAQPLPGGNVLITNRFLNDPATGFVAEVASDGHAVWSYTQADDPDLQKPFFAWRFYEHGRPYTLIADRYAARVFVVDQSKTVVWQYGEAGKPGLGVNRLEDPFMASRTSDGNILIADNLGAERVIEVRYADYRAGEPDNGFTAASIVWQYGTPGVYGSGPDQLKKPRSPQRLANGDTLITDADGQRVIEVDRGGDIVWQYGTTDVAGTAAGHLSDPTYAQRMANGDTLICDTGNGRVLEVTEARQVVRSYDMAAFDPPVGAGTTAVSAPRSATLAADGSVLVADSGFRRIVEIGMPQSVTLTSAPLDAGSAFVKKRFLRIACSATVPDGADVGLEYRLGGGAWLPAAGAVSLDGASRFSLPAGSVAATIAYRVTLTSAGCAVSPVLADVTVASVPVTSGGGNGGGGDNDDKLPVQPQPPVSPNPSTILPVVPGGWSGSGTGAGRGSGASGAGTSGNGAGTQSPGVVPATSVTGSGSEVTGIPVQGIVGAGGADSTAGGGFDSHVSAASLAAGLFGAAVGIFFVPGLVVGRRLRRLARFDHVTPPTGIDGPQLKGIGR